ncbi:MAG: DUF1223 domain-containing protein [Acidobacteria bacterium]|nr:DUF1223 domain-containing protein [Acidobacteriota bacterium]
MIDTMTRVVVSVAIAALLGCAGLYAAGALAVPVERPVGSQADARVRRVPVLVELFTSEGCSSCPPADDLLRRLTREALVQGVEVIAVSEHVDYWNRLGWSDVFSSEQFSDRQRAYAHAFGSEQIYTPQMVIGGQLQAIGSDWPAVRRAITQVARTPGARVDVVAAPDAREGRIWVGVDVHDLPVPAARGRVRVLLSVVEDGLVTDVRRGENARRQLRHDGVARTLEVIGHLDEARTDGRFTTSIALRPEWDTTQVRVVAFLEDTRNRHVLGAGHAPLQ